MRFLYSREVGIGTLVVTHLGGLNVESPSNQETAISSKVNRKPNMHTLGFLGSFDRTLCPAKYNYGQTLANLTRNCPLSSYRED